MASVIAGPPKPTVRGNAGDYLAILARNPRGAAKGGVKGPFHIAGAVDVHRAEDIRVTFQRIRRPLQRWLGEYGRKQIRNARFSGYEFSRIRGAEVAGLAYGFALRHDAFPGIREPPEVSVYVFVRPMGSELHRTLVGRPRSAVRLLVHGSQGLARPFEFHPDSETVAVRHRSVARLPPELFVIASRDFFMDSQRPLQASGFIRRVLAATERPAP